MYQNKIEVVEPISLRQLITTELRVALAQHEEPQLATQLLSSIAHGTNVEFFMPDRDPIFWNLVANRGELHDGFYPVPQGPGWGLELDEDFITRHRL